MTERYIRPVRSEDTPEIKPQVIIHESTSMTRMLQERGVTVEITEVLQGGYMSQVYAGTRDQQPIVIKHTEDTHPTDPTAFFISKDTISTDAEVLTRLMGSLKVKVPKLLDYYPDISTTIMGDLRLDGYELMIKLIREGRTPLQYSRAVGEALAHLSIQTKSWKSFPTTCSANENIYDRGLELRLAYPNKQSQYNELEERFTTRNQGWIWIDGTPKNVMINPSGEVALIDFGLSCFGDREHTLPNYLAHIAVYGLAGYINRKQAADYVRDCVDTYTSIEPIDESAFCKYFGMEILHRSMGKRIPGVEYRNQKLALIDFGLTIFDEKVETIEGLTSLF